MRLRAAGVVPPIVLFADDDPDANVLVGAGPARDVGPDVVARDRAAAPAACTRMAG
jgi:hypothetical protein